MNMTYRELREVLAFLTKLNDRIADTCPDKPDYKLLQAQRALITTALVNCMSRHSQSKET